MKKRKGSVLILVVCIFVVLTVFSLIITTLTIQNSLAVRAQTQRQQAYYLVLTGIELGTNAVYQPNEAKGEDTYILNQFTKKENKNFIMMDEINLCDHSESECQNYTHHSRVELQVRATDMNGTYPCPDDAEIYVEVFAKGTAINGNLTVSHAGSIRISTIDPAIVIRELESPLNFTK